MSHADDASTGAHVMSDVYTCPAELDALVKTAGEPAGRDGVSNGMGVA